MFARALIARAPRLVRGKRPALHKACRSSKQLSIGDTATRKKPGGVLRRAVGAINAWQARNTFLGCILASGLKASAADALVQRLQQKSSDEQFWFDVPRHVAFLAFGFAYGGAFQYLVFNRFLVWLLPARTAVNAALLTAFDVLIHIPFMYLPSFYVAREATFAISHHFAQRSLKPNSADDTPVAPEPAAKMSLWLHSATAVIRNGLSEYRNNALEDSIASMKLFTPAHIITFGVLPQHFRVPWMLAVGFAWMCYLSATNSGSDEYALDVQDEA